MKGAPLVLGACQMVDRAGKPTDYVANVEHSWFDVLKYWLPDSIPTQPSIFFTRQLLEAVRRADGSYLDPELNYVMDYDLWLRIGRRHRFDNRIDDVLSYYRMYDTNKTGLGWTPVHREASRVFARHLNDATEHRVALVLPLSDDADKTAAALAGLAGQSLRDIEVLLVGNLLPIKGRAMAEEMGNAHEGLSLRHVRSDGVDLASILNASLHNARAPIIALVPDTDIDRHFALRLSNMFASDFLGVAGKATTGENVDGRVVTARDINDDPATTIDGLLRGASNASVIAVRRAAFEEIGGARRVGDDAAVRADLLIRIANKGWHVALDGPMTWGDDAETGDLHGDRSWLALLARQVTEEFDREPFARVRRARGWAIQDPTTMLTSAASGGER